MQAAKRARNILDSIKARWEESQVITLSMQNTADPQYLLFIDQFLISTEVVGIYGTFRFIS